MLLFFSLKYSLTYSKTLVCVTIFVYFIILHKVIIVGVLNLKVVASHFVHVSMQVINAVEENSNAESTKDAI